MSQIDVETVKVSALQIIFDILMTFGLDAFGVKASTEENENLSKCFHSGFFSTFFVFWCL